MAFHTRAPRAVRLPASRVSADAAAQRTAAAALLLAGAAALRTAAAALLLAGAMLLSACAAVDLAGPLSARAGDAPWLRTDREAYDVRMEGGVRAVDFELTYENPLDAAVAVESCHSPRRPLLEKQVGNEWVYAFSPVELMCITPPLIIGARATYRFRYAVRIDDWDLARWPGSIDGTYRLVWGVARRDGRSDSATGPLLPLTYRVSGSFTLRGP
jgi:hypothetical protein